MFSFDVSILFLDVGVMPFVVDLLSCVTLTDGTSEFVSLLFVDSACGVPKSNAKYTKQTVLGLIMVLQDTRERKGLVFLLNFVHFVVSHYLYILAIF